MTETITLGGETFDDACLRLAAFTRQLLFTAPGGPIELSEFIDPTDPEIVYYVTAA